MTSCSLQNCIIRKVYSVYVEKLCNYKKMSPAQRSKRVKLPTYIFNQNIASKGNYKKVHYHANQKQLFLQPHIQRNKQI